LLLMGYEKLHESDSLAAISRALCSKRADASPAGQDTQSKVAGPAKKKQKAETSVQKRSLRLQTPAEASQRPKKRRKAPATAPAEDAVPVEQDSSVKPQGDAEGLRRRRKEKGMRLHELAL
jgi:hypothetical protein